MDQSDSGKDKETAQKQRSQNSPEKNAMLLLFGNGKITEDQEKDKEIIDAERKFEDIGGNKLEGNLAALPEKHSPGEGQGEADPQRALGEGFAGAQDAARAVEYEQIEKQQRERENIEENPEVEQGASDYICGMPNIA